MPKKQNKKTRIAINGFGRIGRQFFKIAFDRPELEIVAINNRTSSNNLAYLLKYDSVYGHYDKKVESTADGLVVDGKKIKYFSRLEPSSLPWKDLKIDVVVESTGKFTSYEKARAHLDAGAKRVVLSAPAKNDEKIRTSNVDITVSTSNVQTSTPNINEKALKQSKITSNASCTTNAITPIVAVMISKVGIKYSLLNTVHGYTPSQKIVDGSNPKDFRKGRAGALNIIPSTTGATLTTAKVIPEMKDKLDGISLRVPVAAGSILDFTFLAERDTSIKEINKIFSTEAKKTAWKGILAVTDEPLVSSDILKNPHGAVIDLNLTRIVGGRLVKIMAWYDNEWGYAAQLVKHILSLPKT